MGSATEICTDKTGTLTENKMKVMQYYTNDTVQDAAYLIACYYIQTIKEVVSLQFNQKSCFNLFVVFFYHKITI